MKNHTEERKRIENYLRSIIQQAHEVILESDDEKRNDLLNDMQHDADICVQLMNTIIMENE